MMTDSVALLLLRTTLCTMLAAAMAGLLLRRMHYRSPRLQRVASILVLLQGWMFFPLVLELPTKAAAPAELHNDILISKDQPVWTEPYLRTSAVEVAPASPEAVVVPVNWSAIVWASGAVVVVLWFVRRYASLLHRVPLGRRPTQEEWSREWQHVAGELGVGARAQFRISQELGPLLCFVPFFYLVLCPELLWTALDVNQRKAILKHELAHVKRHDLWKSIGIRMLALPQWFNPLAWMAVRAFDEAAEWACDDLVMTDCGRASDTSYPLALLRIAESRCEPLPGAVAARGGVLSTRIRRLVEPSFREEKKMFKVLLPVLLVGIVCVQSVRVETVAADKPQDGHIENVPKVVSGDTSVSKLQQPSEARKADLARAGLDPCRVEPTDIITIKLLPADRKSSESLNDIDGEYPVAPDGTINLGPTETIACYRQVIELDLNDALAVYNFGNAMWVRGRLFEAIASYRRVIKLDPKNAASCSNLAWYLATAEDIKFRSPKEAVELARKAIELQPENANHWNNLGVAQYRVGQWQSAVEAFQKADALIGGTGDRAHRFFLAMAYWKLGNQTQAHEAYSQAVNWLKEKKFDGGGEQRRFRDEAEQLLGITASPIPPEGVQAQPEEAEPKTDH